MGPNLGNIYCFKMKDIVERSGTLKKKDAQKIDLFEG